MKDKVFKVEGRYNEEFARHVPKDQLEKKYGGEVFDLVEYWPPNQTVFRKGLISRNIAKIRKLFFFKMYKSDVFKSAMPNEDKFTHSSFMDNDEVRKSAPGRARPSFKRTQQSNFQRAP
jgi:hypothetical protein